MNSITYIKRRAVRKITKLNVTLFNHVLPSAIEVYEVKSFASNLKLFFPNTVVSVY